jgi:hypothetical protein
MAKIEKCEQGYGLFVDSVLICFDETLTIGLIENLEYYNERV